MRMGVRKISRVLRGSGGFTIISVLTAFAILLIGIAMVTASVATANNIAAESERVRQSSEDRLNRYYEARLSGIPEGIYSDITVDIRIIGITSDSGTLKARLGAIEPSEDDKSAAVYWFEAGPEEAEP